MKIEPLKIGDLIAKIPVIQGGMGVGVSLSSLAGAVALEGGIGIISTAQIGYRDPEFDNNPIETNLRVLKEQIIKAKDIAKGGIIGVNIMVATRRYDEYVKAAVNAGADLIICGAGLPMKLPELVGKAKTKIAPIVSSLKSANVICKYWNKKYNRLPDMVVIEGPKAGGHLGFSKEEIEAYIENDNYDVEIASIIECINKYGDDGGVKIPIVVAGGVYTRADLEHYLSMGASGVQMATRFVTTFECDASNEFKQAYINSKKEDIILVESPVGMPGRAILNPFMELAAKGTIPHSKCHLCVSTCNPNETPYCITDALVNAAKGNCQDALLFCGTNAYLATELVHVKDIMDEFRS
ncbi:MAG TPA: nitronate monooxygenase [Lachnospiraceae bacterium]|nr:nitronate monooxygenase [Lachnospiraceae bacterium]